MNLLTDWWHRRTDDAAQQQRAVEAYREWQTAMEEWHAALDGGDCQRMCAARERARDAWTVVMMGE